ncbi:MAG: endonuclease MutS2, partial [Flavobacteriales bacterium]
ATQNVVVKDVVKEIVFFGKDKKKKKLVPPPPKPIVILKVGDKVRMIDGKSVGSIDTIEKNKAIVNYGIFTTQVSLDQLEKV